MGRGDRGMRILRTSLVVLGIPAAVGFLIASVFWISYGRMIEKRLGGEQKPVPRIFGRPFELRAGEGLSPVQLEQSLNDVGYAKRTRPEQPGQFAVADNVLLLIPRSATRETPRTIRVEFSRGASPVVTKLTALADPSVEPPKPPPPKKGAARGGPSRAAPPVGSPVDHLTLEAPLLAAFAPGEKRRYMPLASLPKPMIDAVIAIEDRRFFEHPGVDPIRAVGALITNLRGKKPYLVGGSTLTQQIVKNTFLTPEKTLRRKLQEQFMALVLESRFTKDQILELYLNDVTLGQRGPFEIHGVAEAARIFFGKDVSNVTLAEAATIAGLIQSPSRLSPFRNPERAQERRNVVLREMAERRLHHRRRGGAGRGRAAQDRPARARERSAVLRRLRQPARRREVRRGAAEGAAVDVYTTLDLQLQRIAQEALGGRHRRRSTSSSPRARRRARPRPR